MFCGYHITSTGAVRVVEHLALHCVLCPKSVQEPCSAMRAKTDVKRERKEEHLTLVKEEQDHRRRAF